jgi:hypothetical protein
MDADDWPGRGCPNDRRFVRRARSRRRLEMTEHTAVAPESLSEPTEE